MHIGFTGTQRGATPEQRSTLCSIIYRLGLEADQPLVGHHGLCIGADKQFHNIMMELGYRVIIHPPMDQRKTFSVKPGWTALCTFLPPKSFLDRNFDIVRDSSVLIATPAGIREELRSGTWSTVRRARILHRPTYIIWPNGLYKKEG